MWTICWISKEHGNGCDRFKEKEDIINLANTLVREGDVNEKDVFIFPPEAEKLVLPYNELDIPAELSIALQEMES